MDNTELVRVLGSTAFGMLIVVTLGVIYLTVMGWRDRQRREGDRRAR